MRRTSVAAAATFALACAAGAPAGDDAFAGRYGHGHTGQPGEPVWIVARDDDGYRVTLAADGSHAQAWVLDAAGRAAFWKKMDWNPATAAEARCLNWGDPPPPTLLEFLGDAPAAGSPAGASLLCHVPDDARAGIDWLAGHAGGWFYYDPAFGVTEAQRLR